MIKHAILALSLTASAAAAEELDLTPIVAQHGLAGAEALLTDEGSATAFALGGVRFLVAIEETLQLRYRHNATFEHLGVPVLRLPIPANPKATPFYPALVTDLFAAVTRDIAGALQALDQADSDFGVTLDLAKVWFDINENGTQDNGETLFEAAAASLGAPPGAAQTAEMPEALEIRFDRADAAWLSAYAHLLSGVSELALAFDPTEVIEQIGDSIVAMNDLRGSTDPRAIFMSPDDEVFVDLIAMVYGALNRQPNPIHTVAARDHFLAMVADNRIFWSEVAQETDNVAEWIPNPSQTSAFGIDLPDDTGPNWMAVLNDAEAVLEGDLLFPHWRVSPTAGVNVAKLFENPVPVDIVSWAHGHGLIDSLENGPLVDTDNLRQFERMFGGDAMLFMVWLN